LREEGRDEAQPLGRRRGGTVTERILVTGSSDLDAVGGTLTFTDPDLSDVHTSSLTGITTSGIVSGLPDQAILKLLPG